MACDAMTWIRREICQKMAYSGERVFGIRRRGRLQTAQRSMLATSGGSSMR